MIPGVTWFAQLCVDSFGGGPRAVPAVPGREAVMGEAEGPPRDGMPGERGKTR